MNHHRQKWYFIRACELVLCGVSTSSPWFTDKLQWDHIPGFHNPSCKKLSWWGLGGSTITNRVSKNVIVIYIKKVSLDHFVDEIFKRLACRCQFITQNQHIKTRKGYTILFDRRAWVWLEIIPQNTNPVITCTIIRYTKIWKDDFINNPIFIFVIGIGSLGYSYVAFFTIRIWIPVIIRKAIPNFIRNRFYITAFLPGLARAAWKNTRGEKEMRFIRSCRIIYKKCMQKIISWPLNIT